MESVSPQPCMSNADSSSTNPPSQSKNAAEPTEKELPPIINEGKVSSESATKNNSESSQTTTVQNDVPMNTLNLVDYQQMQMYPQSMQNNMIPPNSLYFQSASSQASEMPAIDTSMYYQPPMFIQPGMPVSSYMPVSIPISSAQLANIPSQQPSPIIPPRIPTPPLIDTPILSLSPQISLPPDCDPEFASVATHYSAFTQKMYMSGFLNKQNCLNAEGKLFMVHEWTRWYVELIGAVLTFWSVPDEIVALPPDQITPEIIMMIKQTIPNYLNITDSVVDVEDYAKFSLSPSQPPRAHTFLLNTAGCNLYTLQAPSSQLVTKWIASIRLASYETSKLHEIYTSFLLTRPFLFSTMSAFCPSDKFEGHIQVRYTGSTEWKKVWAVVSSSRSKSSSALSLLKKSSKDQITRGQIQFFDSKKSKKPFMTMYNVYQAYSVYPEKPSLIQVSTIAKIEGSLVFADSASPETLHPTDLPNPLTATPTLVLLMPSNPADMAKWLLSIYHVFKLYDYDSSKHYIPSSSKKSMSQPDLAALAKDQPIIKVTPPTNSNTLYLTLADIEQLPMSGETVVDTKALFDKVYQEKISNVKDKRLSSTTTNSSSSGSTASISQSTGPNIPQRQSSRFSHLRTSVISNSGASDLSKRSSVASSGNGTDTSNTASSSTARTSFTNARGKVVQLGSSSDSDDSNSSLDESSDDDDDEESNGPNKKLQNGKPHSDSVAKVADGIKEVCIRDGDAVDQKNDNTGDKVSPNGKEKSRQNRESFISSATSASYTTDSSQTGHSSTETGTSVTTGTSEEGSTSNSESESETEDSGSDDETTDSSSGYSDGESTSASSQNRLSGVPGANPSFNPNQVDFMSGLHQQQQPVDYMSQQQQALSAGGPRSSQYDPYFNQQFLPLSGAEIPQSSPVTPVSPQFGGLLARPRQSLLSQHHQQRQQYYAQLAYEQQLARQQQEAFDPPNFIGNVAPRPRGPLLSVEPPRRPAPVPSGLISAIDAREQQKSKQRYLHTGFSTSGVAELVERGAGLGKPVTMDFEKDRERLIALEQRKMEKERMEEMKRSEDIMRVKKEQERVMKENAMWMSLGLRPPSSAVPGAGAEGFDPRRSSMYSSLGGAASTPVLPAMAMPGSMSQPAPNTATTPMGMNPMMMNGMLNPMMQQQMLQQQMLMNMNMGMMMNPVMQQQMMMNMGMGGMSPMNMGGMNMGGMNQFATTPGASSAGSNSPIPSVSSAAKSAKVKRSSSTPVLTKRKEAEESGSDDGSGSDSDFSESGSDDDDDDDDSGSDSEFSSESESETTSASVSASASDSESTPKMQKKPRDAGQKNRIEKSSLSSTQPLRRPSNKSDGSSTQTPTPTPSQSSSSRPGSPTTKRGPGSTSSQSVSSQSNRPNSRSSHSRSSSQSTFTSLNGNLPSHLDPQTLQMLQQQQQQQQQMMMAGMYNPMNMGMMSPMTPVMMGNMGMPGMNPMMMGGGMMSPMMQPQMMGFNQMGQMGSMNSGSENGGGIEKKKNKSRRKK